MGLTNVAIKQNGTGLRLCLNEPLVPNGDDEAQEVEWKWIATVPILSDHASIEPGETLREQHILILPTGSHDAVRSELIVVSDKLMWSATGVTTAEQPPK